MQTKCSRRDRVRHTQHHRRACSPKLAAAVSLLSCGATALAASEDSTRTQIIAEVLVTASKRLESLQDVPAAISAITADQLELSGADELDDFFRSVPGLLLLPGGGPTDQVIVIRGISDSVSGGFTQSKVGIYIDEIPITSGQGAVNLDMSLFDVERVTVLRGPQGVLYGAASLGGTIKYETRKPNPERFEARAQAAMSDTKEGGFNYSGGGMLNVPLGENVALRVSAFHRYDDGVIDNVALGEENINSTETNGGRVAALWNIGERLSLLGSVVVQNSDLGGQFVYPAALGEFNQSILITELIKDEFTAVNLTGTLDLGFADLTAASSRFERSVDSTNDGTPFMRPFVEGLHVSFFGTPRLLPGPGRGTSIYDVGELYAHELRLVSKNSEQWQWTVGGFYSFEDTAFASITAYDGFADAFGPFALDGDVVLSADGVTTYRQLAAFGELGYRFANGLRATAGLRWAENEIVRGNDHSRFLGASTFADGKRTSENKVTPKFSLSYDADDYLLYALAAEGYRVGGNNATLPGAIVSPPNYEPDSLWNYEVGLKAQWLDRRLQANLAVFRIDWSNMQSTVPRGDGFVHTINAGDARSRGAELELRALIGTSFHVDASVGYTDAKLTTGRGTAVAGARLPGVPLHTYALGLQYDFAMGPIGSFVRADASYIGRALSAFDRLTSAEMGGYTLGNIRLGLGGASWQAAVFVENATDERARVRATQQFNGLFITPTIPRTIGFSVRWMY